MTKPSVSLKQAMQEFYDAVVLSRYLPAPPLIFTRKDYELLRKTSAQYVARYRREDREAKKKLY